MKNAKTNTNFITKNLQTNVTEISWCYLNNIINEYVNNLNFFIVDMPVCKTYIVIIISLLWVN